MEIFDPSSLPPAPRAQGEIIVEVAGNSFPLALRVRSGVTSELFLSEREAQLIDTYVVGQTPVAAPGDDPVPISTNLCRQVACLMASQIAHEGADPATWTPFDARRWIILADRAPDAFLRAVEFWCYLNLTVGGKLNEGFTFDQYLALETPPTQEQDEDPGQAAEDRAKNGSGALGDLSSEPPSTEDSATPTSPPISSPGSTL